MRFDYGSACVANDRTNQVEGATPSAWHLTLPATSERTRFDIELLLLVSSDTP